MMRNPALDRPRPYPQDERIRRRGVRTLSAGADVDVRVSTSADDGFSDSNDGFFNAVIRCGRTVASVVRDTWARFQSISIDQAARIDAAYVTVEATGSTNDGVGVKTNLYFEDTDDAVAPTTADEHQADVRTAAFTAWDDEDFTVDTPTNSPDISAVVQEIVDRPGWVSGADMMLLWDDDVSTDNFMYLIYDYNDSSSKAALLHVEWSS